MTRFFATALLLLSAFVPAFSATPPVSPTLYRNIEIDGQRVFYRDAGPKMLPCCCCCTDFPRHRSCIATSLSGWQVSTAWSHRIIPALATAMRRRSPTSRTRSIGWPTSSKNSPTGSVCSTTLYICRTLAARSVSASPAAVPSVSRH